MVAPAPYTVKTCDVFRKIDVSQGPAP